MVAVTGGLMGPLGFTEMIVIFIVALLVFGPKKLPELGNSLGKGIREFRKATNDLKSTWDEQVRDIENPINDVKRDINEMGQELKSDVYNALESEPSPPTAELPAPEHPATPEPTESTPPKEHV